MNCPKCQKTLVPMQDRGFAYCPRKDLVIKFGESYDRKFRIELDPESGCGTLFAVPLNDHDWINELDRRYRPGHNRVNHNDAGHGGVRRVTQSLTANANG
jgi:hypothetical protein